MRRLTGHEQVWIQNCPGKPKLVQKIIKYGLQLRIPPSQQKRPAIRSPIPLPVALHEDHDDEDIEREISTQANKNKSGKHLNQKSRATKTGAGDSIEKKLVKERSKEDHLYADKDKFVTDAYKEKLAEQAKLMEEERLRQLRDEKE